VSCESTSSKAVSRSQSRSCSAEFGQCLGWDAARQGEKVHQSLVTDG
jgi:hypothetical protein